MLAAVSRQAVVPAHVAGCCAASLPFGRLHPESATLRTEKLLVDVTIALHLPSCEIATAVKGAANPIHTSPANPTYSASDASLVHCMCFRPIGVQTDPPTMANSLLGADRRAVPGTLLIDAAPGLVTNPFGNRRPNRREMRMAVNSCKGSCERVCLLTKCVQTCSILVSIS